MNDRIMVVDNDPQVARLIASVLMRRGFRSEIVTGAVEAMLRIDRQPEAYACIMTDHGMEPFNGEVIGRHARSHAASAHIKLVLVSGDREVERIATESGVFDDYLGKPFEFDDVLRVILKLVGEPSPDTDIYCPRCGAHLATSRYQPDPWPLATHVCSSGSI